MHTAVKNQTNPTEAVHHAALGDRVQARCERRLRGQRRQQYRGQGGARRGRRLARRCSSTHRIPTRVLQIKVGKNPRGIVVNSTRHARLRDELRFARCIGDRSDHVAGNGDRDRCPRRRCRRPGTLADKIHIGKELYNTSVGEFDPAAAGRRRRSSAACRTTAGVRALPATRRSACPTTSSGSSLRDRAVPFRRTPTSITPMPHAQHHARAQLVGRAR